MKIAHSYNFDTDFANDLTGNGMVSVTNGVLKATGISTGDRALKAFYLPTSGFTRVKVSVMARSAEGKCVLAVDASTGIYTGMTNIKIVESYSKEWDLLELDIIIPLAYKLFRVSFGRPGADNNPSEVYFKDLKIDVEGSVTGSNIVLAQGLLRLQNGTPSVRPAAKSFGFGAISYNATTKEITIPITTALSSGEYAGHPIFQVTGTNDSTLIPLAGSYNGSTFKIKLTDGTQFVDISDKTVYMYISVLI